MISTNQQASTPIFPMQKRRNQRLDFEVDKRTNSIENTLIGEKIATEVITLRVSDLPLLRKLKWRFNWLMEFQKPGHETFALITKGDPSVWHGLVSSSNEQDHMFMHLLESAPVNQGRGKVYAGVPGNLVAYLCRKSFERGHQGVISFEAKTRLIEHYQKELGAQLFTSNRMFINTPEAVKLTEQYFPDSDHDRDRL